MDIGIVDCPPLRKPNGLITNPRMVSNKALYSSKPQLEINVSSIKLKPRKEKPTFDKKVLVIECPLKIPEMTISESSFFESEMNDTHINKMSPGKIRKMLLEANIDMDNDEEIEMLPSELEEEESV